jgi:hypothetical protein
MAKKFLFSVADVYFYKTNSNELIFQSKTLVDSSIEATIQNEDARAGKGNVLQFIYYHSSELNVTLTEQQFNMQMLAPSIGANLITGEIIQVEEVITLGVGGTGTVTKGTPVNSKYVTGASVKGSLTTAVGATEEITFTGTNFTYASGAENDKVTVAYNILSSSTKSITVNSNMIPSVGRLVMKAQLGSSESGVADSTSSVIGEVEIEIPSLQLNPSGIGMSMTASGISQSQLTGRALAFTIPGEATSSYATIKETIYGANAYDNAKAIVITNSDITMANSASTTLNVLVVPYVGVPFKPDYNDVSFTSGTPATAAVGLHTGVVTSNTVDGTVTITASLARPTGGTLTAKATVVVA